MNKMQNEAPTGRPLRRIASWLLISGLLGALFLEFYHYAILHKRYPADVQSYLFASVPRGARSQLELPDGTKVWLNAASLLKYPANMMDGDRTVELTGEAFFDVEKNVSHPFRVKVRDVYVQVLGTRFSIRNYPEETLTKTVVVDGAVKVLHGDAEAVLHTGDQAEIDVSQIYKPAFKLEKGIDTGTVTRWTKGLLEFDNNDWTTVLQDLSRAYNVDIQCEGVVPSNKFTGSFSIENEPLDEIIKRLDFHGLHPSIQKKGSQKVIISLNPDS